MTPWSRSSAARDRRRTARSRERSNECSRADERDAAAARHPGPGRASPARGASASACRRSSTSTSLAAPAATASCRWWRSSRTGHAPRRAAPGPAPAARTDVTAYTRRLWVTRPRPGVDRMGSAWLIRRFIDAGGALRVRHRPRIAARRRTRSRSTCSASSSATRATAARSRLSAPSSASRIRRWPASPQIVHDLDLKDGRFGAPEASTVGTLIEGLQLATADDDTLARTRGSRCFESLYRAFAQSARASGPRPVAKSAPHGPARAVDPCLGDARTDGSRGARCRPPHRFRPRGSQAGAGTRPRAGPSFAAGIRTGTLRGRCRRRTHAHQLDSCRLGHRHSGRARRHPYPRFRRRRRWPAAEGLRLRSHRQVGRRAPGSCRPRARTITSPRPMPTPRAHGFPWRSRRRLLRGCGPLRALQAGLGPRRPGRRLGLALPERRQLLPGARQRARRQRGAVQGRARPAQDLPVKGAGRTYGKAAKVPAGQWSTLRVVATGPRFEVFLNGGKLYQVEDATFAAAGRVGVWTKADSVTHFDDLTIVTR